MSGDYKRWNAGKPIHIHMPKFGEGQLKWIAYKIRLEKLIGHDEVEKFLKQSEIEGKIVDADTLRDLADAYIRAKELRG